MSVSKKSKPKVIKLSSKARDQFLQMQSQVSTFMQGVRSALNVPDDWQFDPQNLQFVDAPVNEAVKAEK